MKHRTPLLALFCITASLSAHADPKESVALMEETHGAEAYRQHAAVAADFTVNFPGAFNMAGTMTFDTPLAKARLDLDDGITVVFDGTTAWASIPDGTSPNLPMLRFHVLTWPYFLAAPFKMSDPGVNLGPDDTAPNASAPAGPPAEFIIPDAKITFDAGTGDAPDDWYYLFTSDKGVLEALSYIVTYTKSAEEAEKQPSIIVYDGNQTIDGVTFSTQWTFHLWDKSKGVKPDSVKGTATISNIRFITPEADTFTKPDGANVLPIPLPE
ncbi:MAG: hypothetical protein AAF750_10950 [Planctomycetota bacterium]